MIEGNLLVAFYVFVLAVFVGFEVITKVPPILHTPLMSGANAISGITLIGALLVTGRQDPASLTILGQSMTVGTILGLLAVALATVNVVGGFMVTDRMLQMFRRRPEETE
ncbi:MAG: NAD(P) transhydrogenase subunit alpha [Dehalococcoidia bacterium]